MKLLPPLALVRQEDQTRCVRLGPQFCVADRTAALATLSAAALAARVRAR
ncbi:MAG: hypothetical protein R6U00_11315 [Prochlorococcaceae cyanobacterium]